MHGIDPYILLLGVTLIVVAAILLWKGLRQYLWRKVKDLLSYTPYVFPFLLTLLIIFMYGMMYNALILCDSKSSFGECLCKIVKIPEESPEESPEDCKPHFNLGNTIDDLRPPSPMELNSLDEALNSSLAELDSTARDSSLAELDSLSAALDSAQLAAYSGRLMWLLAMGLCVIFSIAAVLGGFHVMRKFLKRRWRDLLLMVGFTGVAVGFAALFRLSHAGDPVHLWRQIVHEVLENDLKIAVDWTPDLDTIALAIGFFLAITISMVLIDLYQEHIKINKKPTKEQLEGYSKHFRLILYLGAFLLIVSTLRMSVLFSWSLDYLQSDLPGYQELENIVSTILISQGCFYTLILAVVYLPSVFILRQQARKVEFKPEEREERETWLKHFSLTQHLPRVAAMLGPLVAGPASEILGALADFLNS